MRKNRADLRVPDAKADIYIVGLGVGGFERRTVEADAVLRDSSLIAHLTAFDREIRENYSNADVHDLKTLYESEDDPSSVYERMCTSVLEAASNYRRHGPVSFLTYGHPLFLVSTSWTILKTAPTAGMRAAVVPGTSFLDQLLGDLGVRFDQAVQSYDATLFVAQAVRPDIRFPLILAQVGDFGSPVLRPTGDQIARLQPLVDRLQRLYPPDRAAAVIMSPWRSDMAPETTIVSICDLSAAVSSAHVGVSMLIEGEPHWARLNA